MNYIKISIICFALMMMTMCDKKSAAVKTNYHDLPKSKVTKMKKMLNTNNLETLDSKSLKILDKFIQKNIIEKDTQFGPWVTSNYFWNIYNSLPKFVNKYEQHHGYYANESKASVENRLFAYAIYRIDRSPENIGKIFSMAKPVLKRLLPVKDYKRKHVGRYISSLIQCYDELQRIKDYDIKFTEFYNVTFTKSGAMRVNENKAIKEKYNGAYGFSTYDLSEEICNTMGISRHSNIYGQPSMSFWMRRNKEGNMDEVYKILREVQKIYGK